MNPLDCIDPREGCGKDCFNAVIEISLGDFNKYEIDRSTGLLRLGNELGAQMKAVADKATVLVLPNTGHWILEEKPKLINFP